MVGEFNAEPFPVFVKITGGVASYNTIADQPKRYARNPELLTPCFGNCEAGHGKRECRTDAVEQVSRLAVATTCSAAVTCKAWKSWQRQDCFDGVEDSRIKACETSWARYERHWFIEQAARHPNNLQSNRFAFWPGEVINNFQKQRKPIFSQRIQTTPNAGLRLQTTWNGSNRQSGL